MSIYLSVYERRSNHAKDCCLIVWQQSLRLE